MRRPYPRAVASLLAALIAPLALRAQASAQRPTIDSLIADVVAHRSDSVVDVDRVHRAESAFVDELSRHEKNARAWYGLGIARLELWRAGALARSGIELPVGMNNEYGGEHALIRALEVDRKYADAANSLALAPTVRENSTRYHERIKAARPSHGVMSGPALAAEAFLERESGSIDSALAMERRALAKGDVDSALVMLPLARDLYRLKQPAEGRSLLIAAAGTTSPTGQKAYRSELGWVASPAELAAWDSLPPAARPLWVTNFWSSRDIADGRRDGARLEEHYRRIEYAMATFRIRLPKFGRSKIADVAKFMTSGYEKENEARKNILRSTMSFPSAGPLLAMAELVGSESPLRYYHPVQDVLNDKGIIWIRHGEPSKIALNVHGGPLLEIWRYDRPEGPLILYFREVDFEGSAMANELVPTILDASPVILSSLCSLDPTLCPHNLTRVDFLVTPAMLDREVQIEGERLSPAALTASADRGKAAIDLATTTDSYRRDFAHAVRVGLQIAALNHLPDGGPRIVIGFVVRSGDLFAKQQNGATIYPLRFQVMALDGETGKRIDLDTTRLFSVTGPVNHDAWLTGTLQVPVTAGSHNVSVLISQDDGHAALAHLTRLTTTTLTPALHLSDLVLGRARSGARWSSGTADVEFNPLNSFTVGDTGTTYLQVSGLAAQQEYRLRFTISAAEDGSDAPAKVTIDAAFRATSSIMEINRSVDFSALRPGRYVLGATVTGANGTTKSRTAFTITK